MKSFPIRPEKSIQLEQSIHGQEKKRAITVARRASRLRHIALIREKIPEARRVLCLGCRHESEVQDFIDNGFEAVGIDVANDVPGLIRRMDAHKIGSNFRLKEFDLVYSCHSLEHMYNAEKVLRGIARVSKMGLFAVLPSGNKSLNDNHPSVFDIMASPPDSPDSVGRDILLDFNSLRPFELIHYRKVNPKDKDEEVELLFSFSRREKIAVYTVIVDEYDELKDHLVWTPNVDHVLFTNTPGKHGSTESKYIVRPLKRELDATRDSRRPKILPHEYLQDYDVSLYLDATRLIVGDLWKLLSAAHWHPYSVFGSSRKGVREELDLCVKRNKDVPEIMRTQVYRYFTEGFPQDREVSSGVILLRRHNNPDVIRVMNQWWNEVSTGSRRDQLSIDYAMWKQNFQAQRLSPACSSYFFRAFWHGKKNPKLRGDGPLRRVSPDSQSVY